MLSDPGIEHIPKYSLIEKVQRLHSPIRQQPVELLMP